MTQHPAGVMATICGRADHLVAYPDWSAQQRPFITHIQNIAHRLQRQLALIPTGELALRQIIPTFDASYEQSLVALYGYARMLLDHPASFGQVRVPDHLRDDLQTIYDGGVALAHQIDQLKQASNQERLAQRGQPVESVDLVALIAEHEAIWRYWLRDQAVRLTVDVDDAPPVMAHPYHLADLMRYVLVTMATEFVEYGHLRVTIAADAERVCVDLFCTGTRLTGTDIETLFGKHGRDIYLQKLQQQNGSIACRRVKGSGSAVQIWLQRAPQSEQI